MESKPLCEQIVDKPSARVNASFLPNPTRNGELILFGGECNDGNQCRFFDDTLLYDITTRIWTCLNLSLHPPPRSAHQAVSLSNNRSILMFGGEFGSSKETKFLHYGDTWLFDGKDYTWRALNLSDHPSSRSGHRMARVGRFVFLYGGFHDTGKSTSCRYLDDLWIFEEDTERWRQVTWLNEYEARPAARSGFIWLAHPEGILLYGGYTQTKGKKGGEFQGITMNDLWLLRFDGNDIMNLRWKKLKLSPSAPIPRSGATAIVLYSSSSSSSPEKMFMFGGVCDEEVNDEFLVGQCLNDSYTFDYRNGEWDRLDLVPAIIGARFNAMLSAISNSKGYMDQIIVMGGIFEVGDEQFTLDDIYLIKPINNTLQVECLQSLSPVLEQCFHRPPRSKSESEDESTSSTESSTEDPSDSQLYSESEKSADERNVLDPTIYSTLKEYFDTNQTHWMQLAHEHLLQKGLTEINDKKMRSLAFSMAKETWDTTQQLLTSRNLSLT